MKRLIRIDENNLRSFVKEIILLKMFSRENSRSEDPISSTVSSSVSHSAALEQIKEKLVDAQN